MRIEILYCAWNRREFTSATWSWMLAHTNWSMVDKLVVYDDGSSDGTQEFLREHTEEFAKSRPVEFRVSNLQAPAAIMNHYVATSEADAFVKLDNDIALPGGWLEKLVGVAESHPAVELLGMEAGMVGGSGRHYGIELCSHIGGVGLMRVKAFKDRPEVPYRIGTRIGFTEWQNRYQPVRAWIKPDLDVPQLDRLPIEPWVSLTAEYVQRGWNREWPKYIDGCRRYWEWM